MTNYSQEDLDRSIPEPVTLKNDPPEEASFVTDLYEIDEDLYYARVSEDHDGIASGKKVIVFDVLPSSYVDGWHANVQIPKSEVPEDPKEHRDSSYDDVDVENVEEWIYVPKAKRRVRSAIGPIEEAMEMSGDADMRSDLEAALDLIEKHTV